MNEYAVIIEKARKGYQAYAPDLPGCIAVAKSSRDARALMQKAIELHLRAMQEDRVSFPKPTTEVFYVLGAKRQPMQAVSDVSRMLKSAVQAAAKTGIQTARTGITTAGKTTSKLTARAKRKV